MARGSVGRVRGPAAVRGGRKHASLRPCVRELRQRPVEEASQSLVNVVALHSSGEGKHCEGAHTAGGSSHTTGGSWLWLGLGLLVCAAAHASEMRRRGASMVAASRVWAKV